MIVEENTKHGIWEGGMNETDDTISVTIVVVVAFIFIISFLSIVTNGQSL